MEAESCAEKPGSSQGSFGAIAARGSLINSTQWLVNKVATALAMLLIARFLRPEDYGVANQALAIVQFMVIFFPLTMGDVLIAHPGDLDRLAPTARRISLWVGGGTMLLILASIPMFLRIYSDYPATWLGGLIAIASLKPLLEAAFMEPLARLRLALSYRRIALVDGVVQLGTTALALVMAVTGLRAATLVVPQILGNGVRAIWFGRSVEFGSGGRFDASIARMLLRGYVPAASAQYLHNILVILELLVLGFVSGDKQTGLFAFAFQVAAQANTVVAYQLGVVLQPIFGHLHGDPARQVSGFLRVQRVLGMLCVPISLAQAMIAEPLFRLAFSSAFEPAIPVFQVVSLAQAFYFATGPSMSCLRAQRRFQTFLAWQAIQLAISVPAYIIGARWSGAYGVAIVSASIWTASAPLVVWLCTRAAPGVRIQSVLAVFVRPWLVSIPVFVVGFIATRWLRSTWGTAGDVISLATVGPITALLAITGSRFVDPDMRMLLSRARGFIAARIDRLRA